MSLAKKYLGMSEEAVDASMFKKMDNKEYKFVSVNKPKALFSDQKNLVGKMGSFEFDDGVPNNLTWATNNNSDSMLGFIGGSSGASITFKKNGVLEIKVTQSNAIFKFQEK